MHESLLLGKPDVVEFLAISAAVCFVSPSDCVLSAIGKPVYHRYTEAPYGNWMRDALPRTPADADKYWATKYGNSYHLFEYATKAAFKRDTPTRNYTLPFALKVSIRTFAVEENVVHRNEHPKERELEPCFECFRASTSDQVGLSSARFLFLFDDRRATCTWCTTVRCTTTSRRSRA